MEIQVRRFLLFLMGVSGFSASVCHEKISKYVAIEEMISRALFDHGKLPKDLQVILNNAALDFKGAIRGASPKFAKVDSPRIFDTLKNI